MTITPGTGTPGVTGGSGYTPGAQTALEAAINVINTTWQEANDKLIIFENKIGVINGTTPDGWLTGITAPSDITAGTVLPPTVVEPTVTIPSTIDTSTIYADYLAQYTALRALVVSDLPKIFTDYFPNDGTTYGAAETWVQGAIANPNYGLPAAVQAQIMSDAQAILLSDKLRAQDAVIQQFAARRFPLPPGPAASVITQIEQKTQDAMAEAGRKITMQCIDMMKFAIEEALKMRQMAMGSAMDYLKTQVSALSEASKVIGIGIDAQSKLIHAVSSYYNCRIAAAELTAKVAEFNVTSELQADKDNQAKGLTLFEDRLKALLMEVQTFGQMATAMFNNLHASAGTSYAVNGT